MEKIVVEEGNVGDVDLAFVVDETGSMGSWINSVKDNIKVIIMQILKLPDCSSLKIGIVSYRDHHSGDGFVTKKIDLTDARKGEKELTDYISNMAARGGGDCAEALAPALFDLCRLNWRERAAKCAVVITDAPPHGAGDRGDDFPGIASVLNLSLDSGEFWEEQTKSCQEMGITCHGVTCGSSGITKDVLEKICEITNGVCCDLSDATKLVPVIVGSADDGIDKSNFQGNLLKVIQEERKELEMIKEEPKRVEMLERICSDRNFSRVELTFGTKKYKRKKRKFSKSDLTEAISILKREHEFINSLFEMTGTMQPPIVAGLYSKDKIVPLEEINIIADVEDCCGKVTIIQKFRNTLKKPLEAIYKFPVDYFSALNYFEASIDGRVVVGKCMEKEQAQERYDDAVSEGKTAFLLESANEDMFQTTVGNLPPKKVAEIKVSYVTELALKENGRFSLRIPSNLAPKNSDAKTTITLKINGNFEEVTCASSHKVNVDDNVWTLKNVESGLDEDVVILFSKKKGDSPTVICESGEKYVGIQLNFIPRFDPGLIEWKKKEIWVLIDSSSSMFLYSSQIKKGLDVFFDSLLINNVGLLFNVCSFASGNKLLFENESKSVSKETIDMAKRFTNNLTFSGGSEFFRALETVEKCKKEETKILLVTDGHLSRPESNLKVIREKKINIFPLGVGLCQNTSFLRQVADASCGWATFCTPLEDIGIFAISQTKRMFLRLQETNSEVLNYPLVPDERVNLFFLILKEELSTEVIVNGKSAEGKNVLFKFPVKPNESDSSVVIQTIAAKKIIKEKQEDKKNKDTVVDLATMFNIASKFTSFVAVDENQSEKITENMEKIETEAPKKKAPVAKNPGSDRYKSLAPMYKRSVSRSTSSHVDYGSESSICLSSARAPKRRRGWGCIGSDAYVLVSKEGVSTVRKTLLDLEEGDLVESYSNETGNRVFSKVIEIAHHERTQKVFKLFFKGKFIVLSGCHLIPICKENSMKVSEYEEVIAKKVKVGDFILNVTENGELQPQTISRIENVEEFVSCVFTQNSNIIVNGVYCSVHVKQSLMKIPFLYKKVFHWLPDSMHTKITKNVFHYLLVHEKPLQELKKDLRGNRKGKSLMGRVLDRRDLKSSFFVKSMSFVK